MTADTTPESLTEYTPTTEDILRGFTAPAYRVDPQREGESFSEWLSRCSIESMHSQIASEAAARRWLAAHDVEVARKAAEIAWELGGAEHIAWVNALTDMGPDYPIPTNPYRAEQIGEK